MAIPAILLAIAMVSLFRSSVLTVIIAITVPQIPGVVRLGYVPDARPRHMDRQLGRGAQARDRLTLVAVSGYRLEQAEVDGELPAVVHQMTDRLTHHRAARQVQVQVLEVVLPGAADADLLRRPGHPVDDQGDDGQRE